MVTKKQTNSEKLIIEAKPREVFGKKLRKLRYSGVVPANIFGTDYKSKSISVNLRDLINVYKIAHETGLVYIKMGDEEIPTLIRNVQKHPVNNGVLHADFRKIDLKKKIETEVPIMIVGQSEAINQKGGVLLTLAESLMIEALPQEIPQHIEVDIAVLKDIGQEIKVGNLPKSDKYTIKDDADKVVVSVVEHKEESITPETEATAAPEVITEAAKTEEGAPGQEEAKAPAAKEQKTEEKK